ncbi:glycosyl hydrolase family 61-domain-containing protein [Lasiosphaeria miniovina]|uniref:lytic cellulose monooxygenase (C4-dehydrogenating) n=1 Tax=Lasiosphaeria miniovina TaxID=1954250 RepID=A0AA40AMJ9_9PEZI|nr:glycosyl hydrolase family 61-domain-containing protein [Lasiosphaeria miniovina]KAK0718615.1 glycosyl hydrolase family 61-domain-containing protein [Lasiosphaeria miniovina]
MHLSAVALALVLAGSKVSAHTTMFSVQVDGADQGDGRNVYIRSPPNNNPVKDLASPDLAYNVNGGTAVSSFVKATAGATLTFEWFHNTRGDDIIDANHKGPIITYIAPFITGNGAAPIWTKIAEDGFDGATKLWAIDKLRSNGGKVSFVLPASIAPGQYLVRQELIALHEADAIFTANPARGAQFYPSCVQVEVAGSGSVVPGENFNFNTGYTYADPGIAFNIYAAFTSYAIPGPKVFDGAAAPAVSSRAVVGLTTPPAVLTTLSTVTRTAEFSLATGPGPVVAHTTRTARPTLHIRAAK